MGKIRTRMLGLEDIEKEQKEVQKKKSLVKKQVKTAEPEEVQEKVEIKTDKKAAKKKTTASVKQTGHGAKYIKAQKQLEKNKLYSVEAAIALLKKIKFAKFEESVELHMNVLETGLKGEVALPHSTGKSIRIKIVDDALLEKLEEGVIDFDILIAHPSFMPKLAKHARVLGPKGLMPNPKAGTVSPNPEQVAKKFEKGTLRWKTESKFPLIHQLIGKLNLDEKALAENAVAFINSVGTKNIKAVFIKSTMSPGIKLDIEKIS